jgi:LysM repeat protein
MALTSCQASPVVDRKPKLIAAGTVLTAGVGLAMLFRRTEPQSALLPAAPMPLSAALAPVVPTPTITPTPPMVVTPAVTPTPLEGQLSPLAPVPATNVGLTAGAGALPAEIQVLPTSPAPNAIGGRPAYATLGVVNAPLDETAASPYQIHVVHEGDSLERLAERYLTDSGRSLELFDLNRDVLDNPHLLPIGAELKIPVESDRPAE